MIPTRTFVSKKQASLVIVDFVVLAAVPFLAIYIFCFIKLGPHFEIKWFKMDKIPYFLNILVFMTTFYVMDLYDFKKIFFKKREILNIFYALCFACAGSIFLFYLIGKRPLGRGLFLIYMVTLFILLAGYRSLYSRLAVLGIYKKKAVIVGAGKGGQAVASLIKANPQADIEIVCLLDIDKEKEGTRIEDIPVVCQTGSLSEAIEQYKPDVLILAMRSSRYEKLMRDIIACSQQGIEIQDMTSIHERLEGRIPLKYIDDSWILFSSLNWPIIYYKRVKRLVDVAVALVGLLVTLPISVPVAIAIKVSDGGDIFYRQKRLGEKGKEFTLIKFRSMVQDAEKDTGAVWADDKDPRVTKIGKFIRKLRIDEIPQLVNVLKGDMSIVGPRPERREFVKQFEEKIPVIRKGRRKDDNGATFLDYLERVPYYEQRLAVKPGVTGWAQVMYPYASSLEQTAEKLEYDMFYLKNMSFALDVAIILKTIRVVLLGKGSK
ncbi:MAG: sugar transferase [Deltaproteobacteria bacterium]|nr:sugar transferase [Deltaproteobacteria bacterium]